MANWQAGVGAGLSAAGDAMFRFYDMKRQRELTDAENKRADESLALQRALGEGNLEVNRGQLDLNRTVADREERRSNNLMGLEQMRFDAGMGFDRDKLKQDRELAEMEYGLRGKELGSLDRYRTGMLNRDDARYGDQNAIRLLGEVGDTLDSVRKGYVNMRKSTLANILDGMGGAGGGGEAGFLAQMENDLRQDPSYLSTLGTWQQLMQRLAKSQGVELTPEQLENMQRIALRGALSDPGIDQNLLGPEPQRR